LLFAEILLKAKDYRLRHKQDSGINGSSLKSFAWQMILGFIAKIAVDMFPLFRKVELKAW